MDLSKLIQNHAKELAATARDAASERRTEADLARPAALYRARIERVDARLKLLERQRAETEKRLVTAIEAQKRLREELEKEAKTWEERAPDRPNNPRPDPRPEPGPRPPRPTAVSEKPAKAKAKAKASKPKAPRSDKAK